MTAPSHRIRVIAWVMLGMYLCLAVWLTHIPHPPDVVEVAADKVLHFIGYAGYASFLYIALGLSFPRQRFLWLIVPTILGIWAALDELTQPFFHRDCDIYDWRADMMGVCAAVAVLTMLRIIFERRPAPSPVSS